MDPITLIVGLMVLVSWFIVVERIGAIRKTLNALLDEIRAIRKERT